MRTNNNESLRQMTIDKDKHTLLLQTAKDGNVKIGKYTFNGDLLFESEDITHLGNLTHLHFSIYKKFNSSYLVYRELYMYNKSIKKVVYVYDKNELLNWLSNSTYLDDFLKEEDFEKVLLDIAGEIDDEDLKIFQEPPKLPDTEE